VLGYRHETLVNSESNTETFAAVKLFIDNERWQGVPFYLRTGKRMPVKTTLVMIEFKKQSQITPGSQLGDCSPNRLVIKIHPDEGVVFEFNAKIPGTDNDIAPVQMDFSQPRHFGFNSPQAYEQLLHNVLQADATLFPNWDEIKNSWMFADQLTALWEQSVPHFPNYDAGSWGPEAAETLMSEDGRAWWNKQ
jgi:glucose-6-phosphate 1-dehydrogenase